MKSQTNPEVLSPVVEHYPPKVINKCIFEEIFPNCLKNTKVLPLHKR